MQLVRRSWNGSGQRLPPMALLRLVLMQRLRRVVLRRPVAARWLPAGQRLPGLQRLEASGRPC